MPRFFFWMLAASALGLLKLIAVAQILPVAEFGNYTAILGGGLLSASLLSFGLVETTYKLYPRLWQAGSGAAIIDDFRRAERRLCLRFAVAGLLCAIGAGIVRFHLVSPLILGAAIGATAALLALQMSASRATDNAGVMIRLQLTRAGGAFAGSVALGMAFGMQGALLGEVLGCVVTLAVLRRPTLKPLRGESSAVPNDVAEPDDGGKLLYVSMLTTSSTTQLDRATVNILAGPATAGTYGFAALVSQIGILLMTVLSQRVGPSVVRAERERGTLPGLAPVLRPAALLILASVGALLVLSFLRQSHFYEAAYGHLHLSIASIWLAGLFGMLNITVLLEFWLIAANREKQILKSGLFYAALFFSSFAVAAWFQPTVEAFLVAACLAKLVHLGLIVLQVLDARSQPR